MFSGNLEGGTEQELLFLEISGSAAFCAVPFPELYTHRVCEK